VAQIARKPYVDIQAGRYGGVRGVAPTTMRVSRADRWPKLVAAFALSAVVGMGAYTATYRALMLISEPATAAWVAPVASVTHAPAAPAAPAPGPVR
jgi:hypothetical protein